MTMTNLLPSFFRPRFEALREDKSGAIAVMATFQCAFVVGMIWYVIGVGDSVLYRQAMQDGADSVAYAATVYHARGMNLIAFLNIIMAAILAILIIMKVIQVLNYIAVGVSAILCAIPWTAAIGCPINEFTDNLIDPISDGVQMAQKLVDNVLPVLHDAETVIAVAFPLGFAEFKAVSVGNSIKKPVTFGIALSPSMIPLIGGKDGLPVTDDKFSVLCDKSAKMVSDLIAMPFGLVPGLKSIVSSLVEGTITAFEGYFCGSDDSPSPPKPNADDTCAGIKNNIDQSRTLVQGCIDQKANCSNNGVPADATSSCATTNACSDKNSRGPMPDPYDDATCKKQQKDAGKQTDQVAKSGTSKPDQSKAPKKVIDDAHNGNAYMTVLGLTFGDTSPVDATRKGINVAVWRADPSSAGVGGFDVSSIISQLAFLNFTRAEFYYDCQGAWDSQSCNDKSNAMWNMRWKVKVRRVTAKMLKIPSMDLGDKIVGSVTSIASKYLTGAVDDLLSKAMGAAGGGAGTSFISSLLSDGLDSLVGSYVDKSLKELSDGFGASPGEASYVDRAKSFLNQSGNSAVSVVNGMLGNGSYGVMH